MSAKKIIIVVGAIAVLGAAVVFAFYALNKKNNAPAGQQAATPATTATGGLGSGAGSVAVTTPGFQIHQDQTRPFALILPRQGNGDELALQPPAPVLTPAKAASISSTDITNPDYTNLSVSQFLNKYYPDTQAVVSGANIAGTGTDPALVTYNTDSAAPQTIPDDPAVSSSKFNLSRDNSSQALNSYLQNLDNKVSGLDLASNTNLIINIMQNPDPASITQQQQQVQNILSAVQGMGVPSSVIGMQKQYYDLYQNYTTLLTDMSALNSLGSPNGSGAQADPNVLASKITNDAGAIMENIGKISQDRNLIMANLQ